MLSLLLANNPCAAVEINESGIFSTLQLANLARGSLHVPRHLTHALVEIGCSDFDTLALGVLPRDPFAFSLSFEPMIDKYASILAQASREYEGRDRSVSLGQLGSGRGVVLPIAVSPRGGTFDFHVAQQAGCSSLLEHNRNSTWGHNCDAELETRRVESITLAQALALLPAHLPIRMLKIDAQGVDFQLIRAAPSELVRTRVQRIELEVRSSSCPPLYRGQDDCDAVAAAMAERGFALAEQQRCPNPRRVDASSFNERVTGGCERQLLFVNRRLVPPRDPIPRSFWTVPGHHAHRPPHVAQQYRARPPEVPLGRPRSTRPRSMLVLIRGESFRYDASGVGRGARTSEIDSETRCSEAALVAQRRAAASQMQLLAILDGPLLQLNVSLHTYRMPQCTEVLLAMYGAPHSPPRLTLHKRSGGSQERLWASMWATEVLSLSAPRYDCLLAFRFDTAFWSPSKLGLVLRHAAVEGSPRAYARSLYVSSPWVPDAIYTPEQLRDRPVAGVAMNDFYVLCEAYARHAAAVASGPSASALFINDHVHFVPLLDPPLAHALASFPHHQSSDCLEARAGVSLRYLSPEAAHSNPAACRNAIYYSTGRTRHDQPCQPAPMAHFQRACRQFELRPDTGRLAWNPAMPPKPVALALEELTRPPPRLDVCGLPRAVRRGRPEWMRKLPEPPAESQVRVA